MITTEQLKDFLFSLQFYEYSCHHHEEVERMALEFGIDLNDIAPFKKQQKLSFEVQRLSREIEVIANNNDAIDKIKSICINI